MHICYLDESGDGVTLTNQNINRTMLSFGLVGLIIDSNKLESITNNYVDLKKRFFPNEIPIENRFRRSEWATLEIKGSKLAFNIRSGSKSEIRQTIGFLDNFMNLIERHEIRILGRIWLKQPNVTLSEISLYTTSVQKIHVHYEKFLTTTNSQGIVIADNRSPKQNHSVSHSIHTQKFNIQGNPYPNIIEVPTYGQSQNHTGIQLADLLISGLLSPIAAAVYMKSTAPFNPHVQVAGLLLRDRYGSRLRNLQYMYKDAQNKLQGGVVISDRISNMSSRYLFIT